MKKLIATASAVSMLTFGGMVSAEEQLSLTAMDDVTAGGGAIVSAIATAEGVLANTQAQTTAVTQTIGSYLGQLGEIFIVSSYGRGDTAASSGAGAVAFGYAEGATVGTLASDVVANSIAATIPGTIASSVNSVTSTASTIIIGDTAASASNAMSTSALTN